MRDLDMMEDGAGTMMDFNLQESGSVRSQRTLNSGVGYSPASEGALRLRQRVRTVNKYRAVFYNKKVTFNVPVK